MPKLARVSYRELAAKLRRAGYLEIRTSRHPVYYLAARIGVKAPGKKQEALVTTLVNTGAAISIIPTPVLKRLGVKAYWRRRFVLAMARGLSATSGLLSSGGMAAKARPRSYSERKATSHYWARSPLNRSR